MKVVDLLVVLIADADLRVVENNEVVFMGHKNDLPYAYVLKEIKTLDIWYNSDDGVYSPIVVIRL